MGISGRAWRRLALAVAVPGIALGTLAGFTAAPAMASVAQPNTPGPIETFHAYGTGLPNGDVPMYAHGAFSDYGYISLAGLGSNYTMYLHQGDIYVHTAGPSSTPTVAPQSCNVSYTQHFTYGITGGTGNYSNLDGFGYGRLRVSAVVYRHNGTCQLNDPIPGTFRVLIDASGPVF